MSDSVSELHVHPGGHCDDELAGKKRVKGPDCVNFSYDKKADALSLVIKPGAGVSKDVEIAPNVFVGYGKDGTVTEIQILEVSEMENPWFNLQASAAILGISDRTLQRRIDEGFVNPQKVGREYRFTTEDLEKLRKNKRRSADHR